MNRWKSVIQMADSVVNWLIILCFLPLLLYGIYAVWDSAQVNKQADASVYETYKPSEDSFSFDELRKVNPEVFGWLTVYGTNIDYPLVQAENNSKYVNTDVRGSFSISGGIFLDYRNDKSFTKINNIIYGHHMQKKVMFGELECFSEETYFEKHKYGKIYYDSAWHGVEFFAFLNADAYDPVLYNAKLQGDEGRQAYLSYVKDHAENYRNIDLKSDERYIAMSTCTSSSTNGRHILVGRITEKMEKDPFTETERYP